MSSREGGFTLVEMLVAAAILLTITGAVFRLMHPAQGMFKAQPELSDLQQRLRVGVDSLSRDLIMAGAGVYSGEPSGPLIGYFAPVLPYRIGEMNADPAAGVFFRNDAISVIYVPSTPAQTTIRNELAPTSSELAVEVQANCPPKTADRLCGFEARMRALLFDASGAWDPVTVIGVADEALYVEYGNTLSVSYSKGSGLAQIVMHTYHLKTDAAARSYQLMHYDGASSNLPLVDDVVKLEFEYFGDSQPPRPLPDKSMDEVAGPWTTYGPKPPALGVSGAFGWPAGENCTFRADGGQHVPRLDVLGDGTRLVRLTRAQLTDGPWCPNGESVNRFDADLLRVRRVRVLLRVQVAAESLRGRGPLFMRPGSSIGGERYVPDHEIRFDVTPRNLNLGR